MTYICLEMNNPSRLRGLKEAALLLSNVRLSTVPGEIFTVPIQAGWSKPMACYTIYFDVSGRAKRAIICVPYGPVTNPTNLIMGWPGSDGNPSSNGAYTLFKPYNGYTNVNTWFANLVMAKDCIGLAVDLPAFGYNPYPGNITPDSATALYDDLCAYLAYKIAVTNFISTMTYPQQPANVFMGGYSYGGIRASFTAAMLSTIDASVNLKGVYLASTHLDKRIDTRPEFNPGEWAYNNYEVGGYNYDRMAGSTNALKMRWSFGGNTDYTYVTNPVLTPSINTILTGLIVSNPAKYSRYDHTGGHVPVYSDILSFCNSVL